jgi:signal transduction histidine kinase
MHLIAGKALAKWQMQKNGLIILIGAVSVIAIVVYGLLINQHNIKVDQARSHGIELVRLLSEMPYEQLTNSSNNNGILALTKYYLGNPDFAYSVVTDQDGHTQVSTEQPGIIISKLVPPSDPSGWLAENTYQLDLLEKKVIEFQAPILDKGALRGFIRLAFFYPQVHIDARQIPFLASIALPIILIAGLFLFLMRRELKPLKNIGDVISESVKNNNIENIKIQANGELSEFVDKVNQYVSVTNQKITDLSVTNRDLEASSKILSYQQAKIQSVLQAIPEGMMVFDESGNISFSNMKVSALFDVDNEQMGGNTLEWCKNQQVRSFLEKIIRNPLSNYINDSVEFKPENLFDKKYIAHAYPLFSPKDRNYVQGTLVLFRDYTEESLAKNARGEFIAHVAHELKSPLNVLAMYSESLLREEGESREFRVEAVNVIQDEVERLTMLISNLLNITKIETGSLNLDRQRVKLRDLLQDVFTTIERSGSNKNIKFKLELPNELSSLYVDKDLLRIALNNLLTNAIKYNNDNGVVTLSAEEVDDLIHIRVSDTGIGVSENDQSMIFDKFFRSEDDDVRSRSGHGLGLSLVRDIINLHHGRVEVKSDIGLGAEFTITLENNANVLERAM